MNTIVDLVKFLRIQLCIFASLLAMSGFLIFNEVSLAVFGVIGVAFFTYASLSVYNNITDKDEDIINRKAISPLSKSAAGLCIAVAAAASSVLLSYLLSVTTIALTIVVLVTGLAYSKFRIKRYLLVKNVYTAAVMSLIFFMGAVSGLPTPETIVSYFAAIFMFFFAGSIISDMRDYEGDIKTGIRTLPVLAGLTKSKVLVCSITALMIVSIIAFDLPNLYILAVAAAIASATAVLAKPHAAHNIGGLALIALAIRLLLTS